MQHNQHERDLNIKERTKIRCKEQLGTKQFQRRTRENKHQRKEQK